MGIYNCWADFHPFLLSLYFTSSLLPYSLSFGTEILSFNNSEEGISAEENFLYPKTIQNNKKESQNLQPFLGYFQQDREYYSYKLICVFALLSIISLQQQLEEKLFRSQVKRNGIFQSVQDYFSVFVPLFPFVFALLQLCERKENHNE
jgi:hypothetical protein